MRALISKLAPVVLLLGALVGRGADYTLQIGNVAWTGSPGGYDCFSGTAHPNTVDFTITKQSPGNRPFAVTAGPSSTTGDYKRQLSSGANRLAYQLYTSSSLANVLKAPPTALSGEVLSGRSDAPQQAVVPLSFIFHIPPDQVVPPGSYTDRITFSVYRNHDDTRVPQDTRTITFTVTVAAGAALAVVPSGSSFGGTTSQSLDFGNLFAGQRLGCDLLIRKNTGCNITFNSRNGGVMKLVPTPTADQVPYSCTVNGSVIGLANSAQWRLPTGVSATRDGDRLPVSITIGEFGNVSAGDYQDEIMITVIAQ